MLYLVKSSSFIIYNLSFIIVLSFLLCLVTKLDGVVRTVVIATEAGEAVLVVQPLWRLALATLDVAHRTDVGADTALHAFLLGDVESLVGDEHVLEEATYYLRHSPWPKTFHQLINALLAVEHLLANHLQLLC
mgnify:FL=1